MFFEGKDKKTESNELSDDVRSSGSRFKYFLQAVFFAAIAAFILKTFIVEAFRIPTGSMENTLLVGDFLLVNKMIYGATSPRRIPLTNIEIPYFILPAIVDPKPNDVVVFEYPGDRDKLKNEEPVNYIKRCVAGPGDTIRIIDKSIFLNGKLFYNPPKVKLLNPRVRPQEFYESGIFPKGSLFNEDNYGPVYVPRKNDVIELNYKNIEVWRTLIDREHGKKVVNVEGKIVTIEGYPVKSYTVTKDYYFMIGDNRDDSFDSRFWGYVPRDKIIGEAIVIYWSWDPSKSNIWELLGSIRVDRIAQLIK